MHCGLTRQLQLHHALLALLWTGSIFCYKLLLLQQQLAALMK